jgi:membrane-bound inhibitor of C-type lysozyme
MNRNLTMLTGVFLCAGLAACSTPKQHAQELSQQTIEYNCGQGSTQPLSVQYTFQGDDALAAKVIYNNQAMDLTRATTSNVDMVGNTFRGNGYTWTTEKFTRGDAGMVNGKMLTQETQQVVSGQNSTISNIIVQDCRVVRAS